MLFIGQTLNYYASNIPDYAWSDVVMRFLPGNHSLNQSFYIGNKRNLQLTSFHPAMSVHFGNVSIHCTSQGYFHFWHTSLFVKLLKSPEFLMMCFYKFLLCPSVNVVTLCEMIQTLLQLENIFNALLCQLIGKVVISHVLLTSTTPCSHNTYVVSHLQYPATKWSV